MFGEMLDTAESLIGSEISSAL